MRRHKAISIIGSVGIPSNYGGFETLVEFISRNSPDDVRYHVFCSAKAYEEQKEEHNNAKLHYIDLNANGIQSIPYDIISLLRSPKEVETILVLGVASGLFLPIYKWLNPKKKIILNVDGLEWKRDKWNSLAKFFLKISEMTGTKAADIVIADNPEIQKHLKESYQVEAEHIPYGGDHTRTSTLSNSVKEKYPFLLKPYFFKVCRIEPENNVHLILSCFNEMPRKQLVIVGNWERNAFGKEMFTKYAEIENLHLLPPIYDQNVLDQIRSNAFVYIHGHSAGGTNPSLVEAMCLGLPIIAYDVEYNRETTNNKALYFKSKYSLSRTVDQLEEKYISALGKKMREIGMEHYTWKKVTESYLSLF